MRKFLLILVLTGCASSTPVISDESFPLQFQHHQDQSEKILKAIDLLEKYQQDYENGKPGNPETFRQVSLLIK